MDGNARRHVLTDVGVTPDGEDVYQFLLGSPGATTTEISRSCGFSRSRVRTLLAELEDTSLVSRHDGSSSPRFHPAPPDVAVEALISAKEAALSRARLDAWQLGAMHRVIPEQTQVSELVELLTSRQASAVRWDQMQGSARTSLEAFVRPPFTQPRPEDSEPLQEGLLRRGIRARAIYDRAALQHPGILEHARRMAALGEEARVVGELPVKLVLIDRTTAMLPFMQADPDATIDAGLVVHRSTLLEALTALFDLYWEQSTELRVDDPGDARIPVESTKESVLTLMAAGFKDDSIASQLGLSTATVRRRISEVQGRLRVTTRFQAGLALGRSGWRSADAEEGPRSTTGSPPSSGSHRRSL